MANYFNLTRKNDLDAGPVSLSIIDNEICAHFGAIRAEDKYYFHWFDTIGFSLAIGQTFDQIMQECHTNMVEYHDSSSYYETKLKIS